MPELKSSTKNISSSKMKSEYSSSVHKKEFGVLATVVPTIIPSSTSNFASPLSCFQPERSLPLKRSVHLTSSWNSQLKVKTQNNPITKLTIIFFIICNYTILYTSNL